MDLPDSDSKVTLVLSTKQSHEWLYYETGFEQLHPIPDIVYYMEAQGYVYEVDWWCKKEDVYLGYPGRIAKGQDRFIFNTAEIAAKFLLRFS
jgi:hypothetical protein